MSDSTEIGSEEITSRQSFVKRFGVSADELRARKNGLPLQRGMPPHRADQEGGAKLEPDEPVGQMSRFPLPTASQLPPPKDGLPQLLAHDHRTEPTQWSDAGSGLPRDAWDGPDPGGQDPGGDFLSSLWGTRQTLGKSSRQSSRQQDGQGRVAPGTAMGLTDPDQSAPPLNATGWQAMRRNVRRAVQSASHAFQPSGSAVFAPFASPQHLRRSVRQHETCHSSDEQRSAGRSRRRAVDAEEREERAADKKSAGGSESARPPQIRRTRAGQKGSQRDLLARTRLEVTLNKLRKEMPAAEGLPAPKPSVFRRQGSCAPAGIDPRAIPMGGARSTQTT